MRRARGLAKRKLREYVATQVYVGGNVLKPLCCETACGRGHTLGAVSRSYEARACHREHHCPADAMQVESAALENHSGTPATQISLHPAVDSGPLLTAPF